MKDHILAKQIQAWWPQLDEKLTEIENNAPAGTPPKRSTHEMLEEVLTLLRDLSRQAPTFVGSESFVTGIPWGQLTGTDPVLRLEPAPPSLAYRDARTRRATPFGVWAWKIVLDNMGREAVDKVDIYFNPDAETVGVVSDLEFPDTILSNMQDWADELKFSLTFSSTDEFKTVRKSGRFIRLPRDMLTDRLDLDK